MSKKQGISEEKIIEILEELKEKVVIVEGKKDEKALKSLGVKNIIAINGKPLYRIMEIALKVKEELVILTDFDKKGREIEKRLKTLLQKHGENTNSKLRCKIMSLGKNSIEDLGNLSSPYSLKEDDIHVKISTNFNKIRNKSRNRRKRSNRET